MTRPRGACSAARRPSLSDHARAGGFAYGQQHDGGEQQPRKPDEHECQLPRLELLEDRQLRPHIACKRDDESARHEREAAAEQRAQAGRCSMPAARGAPRNSRRSASSRPGEHASLTCADAKAREEQFLIGLRSSAKRGEDAP